MSELQFKVTFNLTNPVKTKPDSEQVKTISNNLVNSLEVSTTRLADAINKGYCFSPATFNGKRSNDNFVSQQAFVLDFDSGISMREVYNQLGEYSIVPNIAYTTFSHTEAIPKFRVIIILTEPIYSKAIRDSIQLTLMKICPQCDIACKDAARLFYPSLNVLDINHLFTTNEELLEIVETLAEPIVYQPVNLNEYKPKYNTKEAFNLIVNYVKKKSLSFTKGSRHNFTVTFAGLANQFGLSESECYYEMIKLGCVSSVTQAKVEDIYKRYAYQFNTKSIKPKYNSMKSIIR